MIQVNHNQNGEKVYVNIETIAQAPKGVPVPESTHPTQVLEFERFDTDVYDSLPEWLQEKIAAAPEYLDMNDPVDEALNQEEPAF